MDIKDIYGHLGIMNLDNNYLMSMALAYKEVNKSEFITHYSSN